MIGSSFIGMEVASSLASREISVHVIGRESVPFEGVLGEEVGRRFQQAAEEQGATFHLFDICRETPKKKQMYAKKYLSDVFGDRFNLHCGKSAEIMEGMEDLKCDVIHIDGYHSS